MPVPRFELSETTMRSLLEKMASIWNKWAAVVRSLAQGEDWGLFFKVAVPLYVLKSIISYSFAALAGGVLIFSFTSFFIYEQYEEEIDRTFRLVVTVAKCSSTLLLACLPPHIASFFFDDDDLNDKEQEQLQQPTTKE
uniref:Reticulon domain-containing protein n=1 Tax=Opuntia streptacantha TaxID=393608 RepID=A0A7C8YQE9_OPUST